MKTSVSSYSFSHLINTKKENQISIIEKAKNLGFDAIEFTDLCPPEHIDIIDFAKQIKEKADALKIDISCYSVSADLLTGSNGNTEEEIERIKTQVNIAEILGVKLMRHDATFSFPNNDSSFAGFLNVVDVLAYGCKKITEYAEFKGIKTMIENHGLFCQDSDRIELLIKTVAHKNFGALVDIGNFLCADEDPHLAVSKCAAYALNVHVKDFIFKSSEEGCPSESFIKTRANNYLRGTILGHGIVPINKCIDTLKKSGYNGYLTLEFEGLERTEIALEYGYNYIKQFCIK